jgi:hypothetical protein
MPAATPDDFDADNPEKVTSAIYNKFFLDSVNHQSTGRWQVYDDSGKKSFLLSNNCYSAPKAWMIGGNYWNREDDDIVTNPFDIADGTDGIRLSFFAKWKIAGGSDQANVWFWDGTDWQFVTNFMDGQNADYPGWTKYYFELPANNSGNTASCLLNFTFNSDTSGTDWGFAVDSIAVYQRQLEIPVSFQASDSDGSTYCTWSASTDPLEPEAYEIWRADTEFGTYELVDTTFDPANDTQSENVSDNQCPATNWYKARAIKTGWPPGEFTDPDEGCWNL